MNQILPSRPTVRANNPFDDGAEERLRRMGLLSVSGDTEETALSTLSRVFAGLLFDDLCNVCQDYPTAQAELRQLFEAAEQVDPRQQFLLICLQYDRISLTLPDPIWWISGNPGLAGDFAVRFIGYLKNLVRDKEVIS